MPNSLSFLKLPSLLIIFLIELLVLFPLFIEPMCGFALEEGSEGEHGVALASEEVIDPGQHNTRHDSNKDTGQNVSEDDAQKNIFKVLVVIVAEVLGFLAGYFGARFFLKRIDPINSVITHRNNGYKERETS